MSATVSPGPCATPTPACSSFRSTPKKPLTLHGFKDATSDPEVIKAWRRKWAHCDFGWAVPADVIVVDVDVKHGKNGYADFKGLAGCDPRES